MNSKQLFAIGREAGHRALRFYHSNADVSTLLLRLKFRDLRRTFYRELWGRAARNVGATAKPWRAGYEKISRGDLSTITYLTQVNLNSILLDKILMDKEMTQDLLLELGYPTPRNLTFSLSEIDAVLPFFEACNKRVVIKPASGTAGGRGVTTNIQDIETLRHAVRSASRYASKILIEQHITGASYRLIYIGGKFADAVRRDPATVTGDGKSTIRQLIKAENKRRLNERPISALLPLLVDNDCKVKLASSGLSLKSCLPAGQVIEVKQSINDNSAAQNHNVRYEVHPETIAIGEEIMRDLGITLGGIDVQCEDISKPLSETGGAVLEINSPPGIHHHYLIANPDHGVPIAEQLLEFMFSNHLGTFKQQTPARQQALSTRCTQSTLQLQH